MPDLSEDNGDMGWQEGQRPLGRLYQQSERMRLQLAQVIRDVEGLSQSLRRLHDDVGNDSRKGDQRGFSIMRLEEQFADVKARIVRIEADYVTRERMKEEVSPIWKWTSIAGVAIIGAIVAYVSLMLQGKVH